MRAILIFLFIAGKAHALIYAEPFLGIQPLSSLEYKLTSDEDVAEYDSGGLTQILIGTRLGYYHTGKYKGLGGIEIARNWFELEGGDQGAPFDLTGDWRGTYFGLYLGYEFPYNIVFHWTYYLSSRFTNTAGANEGDSLRGDGFAINLAYKWYNWLKTGLEYRRHKLEDYRDASTGAQTITTNRYETKGLMLFVSFPLSILGEPWGSGN
jgi:hypothetical protein